MTTIDTDVPKPCKFIGITFDQNCEKGENILNKALGDGYTIIRDYRTESGIVFQLVLEKKSDVDPNQKSLDYNAPIGWITKEEQK